MPYLTRRPILRIAGRLAAVTCVAMFATTGAAFAASCPTQPTTTPYAQFGDSANYFLAPGGSFEGTAASVGWSLNNAALTAGNEPFYANLATDSQSLTINGGGSATSPYFCLDSTLPTFRFFAKQAAAGTDLRVDLLVRLNGGNGGGPTEFAIDLPDGSTPAWAPIGPVGLLSALPMTLNSAAQVALRFSAPNSQGAWQIDDVYVDPYRAG